jgi:hypothetical protein
MIRVLLHLITGILGFALMYVGLLTTLMTWGFWATNPQYLFITMLITVFGVGTLLFAIRRILLIFPK